jgi:hypothetical protein
MVPQQRDDPAAEVHVIVAAMSKLRASPELLNLARTDARAALDRLGLAGAARQAVAATLALTLVGAERFALPDSWIFWSV